jgi:hypothetical protein
MKSSPRDYRLFHYTSCVKHVRDILLHGFWPRYCAEDFTWLIGRPAFIAFPVVCFCDIPIPSASQHRYRYGRYALAMDKLWSVPRDINPVWYINAASSIYFHFDQITRGAAHVTLASIPELIRPLLPFLKLTVGDQPAKQHTRHAGSLELVAFEEELEWRHTPRDLRDTWKFGFDRDIVAPEDHEVSKSHRLPLPHKDVDSIYVCTAAEKQSLIKEFPELEDKVMISP